MRLLAVVATALALLAPRAAWALTWSEVASSLSYHPDLARAQQALARARGASLRAEGAFDTGLRASAEVWAVPKAPYGLLDLTLVQPLTVWGVSAFAGWRLTPGEVPIYKDQYSVKTDRYGAPPYKAPPEAAAHPGELTAGLAASLLRDGPIDKSRAERLKARYAQTQAEHELAQLRLELGLRAATAYWRWVGAGVALRATQQQALTARERFELTSARRAMGELDDVDLIDAERTMLRIEAAAINARRELVAAAQALSLFWRDERGAVRLPPVDAAPPDIAPSPMRDAQQRARDREGLDTLPALLALRAKREQLLVAARLANNQLMPGLDLTVAVAQPLHAASPQLVAGLALTLPLQLREARGMVAIAEAELLALDASERAARDAALARHVTASARLDAAAERLALAQRQAALAQRALDADTERLRLGEGTLLVLNLRAQDLLDARLQLISALAELQVARAEYLAASGLLLE